MLDTNVLVSVLLAKGGTLEEVWRAWRDGRFEVLVSEALLDEVTAVLSRPKIARLVSVEDRAALLGSLRSAGLHVRLHQPFPQAPDPADDFLLAMMRDGEAEVLVTGDSALRGLGTFGDAVIVSAREFVEAVERSP